MSIYVSFRSIQKAGNEFEPVDDVDLPELSFFWSEISDLIDGFRDKLLEYDPTIQFHYFDNQGENGLNIEGDMFNPGDMVITIRKIQNILEKHALELPPFYIVDFPGYANKPLNALDKLGVDGKEVHLFYGFGYCYYTFLHETTKSVSLQHYDKYTFELLDVKNGKLVVNNTITACIIKHTLHEYYGKILKKIEPFCTIAERKNYSVGLMQPDFKIRLLQSLTK